LNVEKEREREKESQFNTAGGIVLQVWGAVWRLLSYVGNK